MGPAVWSSGRLQRPPVAHSSQSSQSSHFQHAVGAHDNVSGRRGRVFAAASPSLPSLPSLPASPPPQASTPPSRTTADESCTPRRSDTFAGRDPALIAPIASPAAATVHPSPAPSSPPEHRRLDGSADVAPFTAPNELGSPSALAREGQSRFPKGKAFSQQSFYPNLSPASATELAATAVAAENQEEHLETAALRPHNTNLLTSPFRKTNNKTKIASRSGRPSASRLWNPTNSTPRTSAQQQQQQRRKRRPSSPLPPSVPLQHPALCALAETDDPYDIAAGSFPLLTLSEQRQSRHAVSGRTNFLVEGSGTNNRRISLPRPIRTSADAEHILSRGLVASDSPNTISRSGGLIADAASRSGPSAESKGKQKATMAITEDTRRSCSRDLERGPDVVNARLSTISAADGIGTSISSSNSSIMGEDVQPDAAEEWGPQHPCYPHLNPHVPPESTEYATTRIIRVKRDWLVAGDLAPTFSNLYPEILDPAGVSEQEFRRVVDKLNAELVPIFNPYGWRNMLDAALGLVTGWLWDDFGMTAAKGRMNALEAWMERWNGEMEKTMAEEEGVLAPKLIPLRQTGYMSLDIQIPDPEIAPAPSSVGAGDSRTALPLEPIPATPPER
ncbi:hypothetical protein E4U31_004467 [Claviceps sp. LM219 group G6]|nr:hypothetical protein E4U31_004467 [Claviceps sp. LM219 group G6]